MARLPQILISIPERLQLPHLSENITWRWHLFKYVLGKLSQNTQYSPSVRQFIDQF